MEQPTIVIAVPTFRRPHSLRRLLDAIARLEYAGALVVMVADNDAERQEGLAVCRDVIERGYAHELITMLVPARGLSNVRNHLITSAMAIAGMGALAMLDDDEWPEPQWLSALTRTMLATNAEIVGGPVRSHYALPVPSYVARCNKPLPHTHEGLVRLLDSTSNILLRRDVFTRMPEPWFDPAYVLEGGGDKEFLYRAKLAGMRFSWSADAWVNEEMCASRSTEAWALQRAYRIGNSDMQLRLRHHHRVCVAVSELVYIGAATVLGIIGFCLGWNANSRFLGKRHLARVRGKIDALRGRIYQEYAVTHGS